MFQQIRLTIWPTVVPNVLDAPTITVTFDDPIDYATLLHSGVTLRNTSQQVITNITLNYVLSTDQKTLTITTSGLVAATTYHVSVGYYNSLYDISGNNVNNSGLFYFTTQ